jgi:hypothetical protein
VFFGVPKRNLNTFGFGVTVQSITPKRKTLIQIYIVRLQDCKIGDLNWGLASTCLFTRLEESSLVPAVFLTAQFLQKT